MEQNSCWRIHPGDFIEIIPAAGVEPFFVVHDEPFSRVNDAKLVAQLDVPVRHIDEMFPALVVVSPEGEVEERSPSADARASSPGASRPGAAGGFPFAYCTGCTSRRRFPRWSYRRGSAGGRDRGSSPSGQKRSRGTGRCFVPLEYVVPGEFHFLGRQPVEQDRTMTRGMRIGRKWCAPFRLPARAGDSLQLTKSWAGKLLFPSSRPPGHDPGTEA